MSKKCKNCFYYDQCGTGRVCGDYTPLCDDDEYIDKLIEKQRAEFIAEWLQYITQDC